jgi:hypothetical protein
MSLFTTALGLYGGVLQSGELQGFIIHEAVPSGTIIWAIAKWNFKLQAPSAIVCNSRRCGGVGVGGGQAPAELAPGPRPPR